MWLLDPASHRDLPLCWITCELGTALLKPPFMFITFTDRRRFLILLCPLPRSHDAGFIFEKKKDFHAELIFSLGGQKKAGVGKKSGKLKTKVQCQVWVYLDTDWQWLIVFHFAQSCSSFTDFDRKFCYCAPLLSALPFISQIYKSRQM